MDRAEERIIQNLLDAGYCPSECKDFLRLPEEEQKERLENKRREILTELHAANDRLECLDYLRYQYQNRMKREENQNG